MCQGFLSHYRRYVHLVNWDVNIIVQGYNIVLLYGIEKQFEHLKSNEFIDPIFIHHTSAARGWSFLRNIFGI